MKRDKGTYLWFSFLHANCQQTTPMLLLNFTQRHERFVNKIKIHNKSISWEWKLTIKNLLPSSYYPAHILSNLSTLFRALSICSLFFRDIWMQSTLLLDFSIRSKFFFIFSDFGGLLILLDFRSLRSVLFLELLSCRSVLCLDGSDMLFVLLFFHITRCEGGFSTVDVNFFRCRKYSGYVSKSQWLPPLSHNGSYFSLHNPHSFLPCEKSTTSSAVP